jgi:two-component system, probable response regulator PhcQ
MTQDYTQHAVLYVDDEPHALKYFAQAFGDTFDILTASGVDEALTIVDAEHARIGIVIADQRMPQRPGTDLLATLRAKHPSIIRILTTAYSDLDSAIAGVNEGAIYRYIVKPWDLQDLRIVLMRAMDFFVLQQERDHLLNEKMAVLQQMLMADRVKSLTLLAATLGNRINATIESLLPDADASERAPAARANVQSLVTIVHKLASLAATPSYTFADEIDLEALFRSAAERVTTLGGAQSVDIAMELATDLPMFKLDREMIEQMIRVLIEQTAARSPGGGRLMVSASDPIDVGGTPGVRIVIAGEGDAWDEHAIAAMFTPLGGSDASDAGLDLLGAFFTAHHHGGSLAVLPTAPDGPGFEVRLPFAPATARRASFEDGLLQKVLLRLKVSS